MAKPTEIPEWNSGGTNRTTPTGGQKAAGIASGETSNSSRMNWVLYWLYQWVVWLDAGVLTGVSYVASGIVTVGGLLTASAGLALTGALTMTGNLAVTGNLTWTGSDYYPETTRTHHFLAGKAQSGVWTRVGQQYISGDAGAIYEVPISPRVGDRVRKASVSMRYDGSADTVTVRLMKAAAGTVTTLATSTSATPGGGALTVLVTATVATPADGVVVSGDSFWIEVEYGATTSTLRVYNVQHVVDRVP